MIKYDRFELFKISKYDISQPYLFPDWLNLLNEASSNFNHGEERKFEKKFIEYFTNAKNTHNLSFDALLNLSSDERFNYLLNDPMNVSNLLYDFLINFENLSDFEKKIYSNFMIEEFELDLLMYHLNDIKMESSAIKQGVNYLTDLISFSEYYYSPIEELLLSEKDCDNAYIKYGNSYSKNIQISPAYAINRLKLTDSSLINNSKFDNLFSLITYMMQDERRFNFKYVGHGSSGIILKIKTNYDPNLSEFNRDSCIWKFSLNAKQEYDLLASLSGSSCEPRQNMITLDDLALDSHKRLIISLFPEHFNDFYGNNILEKYLLENTLPIKYFQGKNLEELMMTRKSENNGNNKFSDDEIFHYMAGLINGLYEMKSDGIIRHRDLRPSNIIVTKKSLMFEKILFYDKINKYGKTMIIDFGIATRDENALSKDNRRYGSLFGKVANDLMSVGQIAYKMMTGIHLFSDSDDSEFLYPELIMQNRNKAYHSGKLDMKYINRINSIENADIKEFILFCMTQEDTESNFSQIYKSLKSNMLDSDNLTNYNKVFNDFERFKRKIKKKNN